MVTEEDIERRNSRLKAFFTTAGMDVDIIGDPNTPAIIHKNKECLSCYVHNFYLRFTNIPSNGKIIYEVKLGREPCIELHALNQWYENSIHRRIFRIKVLNTKLFLAGYNFINVEVPETRYPVFAEKKYKYYFDRNYAQTLVDKYTSETLNLEVI